MSFHEDQDKSFNCSISQNNNEVNMTNSFQKPKSPYCFHRNNPKNSSGKKKGRSNTINIDKWPKKENKTPQSNFRTKRGLTVNTQVTILFRGTVLFL